MAQPQVITANAKHVKNDDTARFLISPGAVKAPGKHSSGQMRHARPYLVNGKQIFIFPVGAEGFERSGTAQVGLHHYLNDNSVDTQVTHREEARISLNGTFPGATSQANMIACINMLRSLPGKPGLELYVPGVFGHVQYVTPENWTFTHDPEDRTHSIQYDISLIVTGTGKKVNDPRGVQPPANPTISKKPKGKSPRTFIVTSQLRTFRAISKRVYGDQSKWQQLVALNGKLLESSTVPTSQIPTHRWKIGTKVKY